MTRLVCFTSVLALTAGAAAAQEMNFNRIASFPVAANLPEGTDNATETSAEIMVAAPDGQMLVYSDSPLEAIGMVDISDPANPAPAGVVMLEGEPTSVTVVGGTAFVSVNTSESFTDPSGFLAAVALETGEELARCDLGGQPDAIAAAPDDSFLAIAIENERDEDLDGGEIPQLPAGNVVIVPLEGDEPQCEAMIVADVTGLAEVAPDDPEPEFVDINETGDVAVTLQENNHVVILGRDGAVKSHFPAGSVFLQRVDTQEEGAIVFADTTSVKREPDAVKWIDTEHVVIANEGDYEGGSRGFTIFSVDGEVVYESSLAFEYAVAAVGHYPEERSANKGAEPEGLEFGTFDGTPYIFVLSERGSVVGVYDDSEGLPQLVQMLPSGIGPEGAVAIPDRGLFATANEVDLGPDGGIRAHVMIYALQDGPPSYPTITSTADTALPIAFGALSGLVADPQTPTTVYAVNDSFYSLQPTIFVVDASEAPALIVDAISVRRGIFPAQKLDLEGITTDGEGGFWLASEGRSDRLTPHALYRVDGEGQITEEVPLPPELLAGERRFGAEGVTRVGPRLWIAIQREWGDDPEGLTKLVSYDTESGEWGAVHYPLESAETGWMGLSEITAYGDALYLLERDNQIGENARVKQITRVSLDGLEPAPIGGELPVVTKEVVRDLIPDLKAWNSYVVDKVEGLAINAEGTAFIVTDNDGVDDSSGETHFWSVTID